MDLLLTHSFLTVAETGSITDAAEQLGVTQSALSRRIQQYEEQLGGELLTRSRKGTELTEIGKIAVTEGQLLLAGMAKLRREIARHQGLEGGQIRIGGGATAVSFIMPSAIAHFQSNHPKILFQMKEAGSSEIADDVLKGQLELGIVTLPLQSRELEIQLLTDDDIVLVARNDHPLSHKKKVSIKDLTGQPFVSFEGGTALRKIIDDAMRKAEIDIQVVMELRSIPSILHMVATTGNLAFVSRMAVGSQPDVIEITVSGLQITRRMAIISRKHGSLSEASQAFVSQLLQYCS